MAENTKKTTDASTKSRSSVKSRKKEEQTIKTREMYSFGVSIVTEEGKKINAFLESIQEKKSIGSYVKDLIIKDMLDVEKEKNLLESVNEKLSSILSTTVNNNTFDTGTNIEIIKMLSSILTICEKNEYKSSAKLELMQSKMDLQEQALKSVTSMLEVQQKIILSGGLNINPSNISLANTEPTSETAVDTIELTEEQQIEALKRQSASIDLNATEDLIAFNPSIAEDDEDDFSFGDED